MRRNSLSLVLTAALAASCSDQTFTTNVDVTLAVIAVTPSGNTDGVPIDAEIRVLFNQEVQEATLTSDTVRLEDISDVANPVLVTTTLSYAAGDGATAAPTLAIVPVDGAGVRQELAYSHLYRLTLTSGIARVGPPAGTLPNEVVAEFRVIDPPPLYLLSRLPGPDAGPVLRTTTSEGSTECPDGKSLLRVVFSEAVKTTQIDADGDGDFDVADRLGESLLSLVDVDIGSGPIDALLAFHSADGSACAEDAPCVLDLTPRLPFCRFGYSQSIGITFDAALESTRAARVTDADGAVRIRGTLGEDKDFAEPSVHEDVSWSFRVEDPPALSVLATAPGDGVEQISRSAALTLRFTDGIKQTQIDTDDDGDWDAADRAAGGLLSVADADTGDSIDGTVQLTAALELDATDAEMSGDDLLLTFTPFSPWGYSQLVRVTLDGGLESDRATRITDMTLATRVRGTLGEDKDFSDAATSTAFTYTFRAMDPPALRLVASVPGDKAAGVARADLLGNPTPVIVAFSEGLVQDNAAVGSTIIVEDVTGLSNPYDTSAAGTPIAASLAFVDAVGDVVAEGTYDANGIGDDAIVRITPTAVQPYATKIRVSLVSVAAPSLAGLVSDRATTRGGQLDATHLIVFELEKLPALTVVRTSPSDLAINVATGATFTAQFSEALDCDAVAGAAALMTVQFDANDPYDGANPPETDVPSTSVVCDADTLTFTPAALDAAPAVAPGLEYSRRILVTLPAGIRSLRSSEELNSAADQSLGHLAAPVLVHYRLVHPDALRVTEISPSPNGVGVAPDSDICVTFSEAVNPSSVTGAVFMVEDLDHVGMNLCPASNLSRHLGDTQVCCTPSAPFVASATIRLTLANGTGSIESARATTDGGWLVSTPPVTFQVKHPAPLQVIRTVPSGSGSQIDPATQIQVVFAGLVDAGSLTGIGPAYVTYSGADILDATSLRSNSFFVTEGATPNTMPTFSYDELSDDPTVDFASLDDDRAAALGASDGACSGPCDWSDLAVAQDVGAGTTTVTLTVPRPLRPDYFYAVTLATEICSTEVNGNTPVPSAGCLPQVVRFSFQVAPTPPLRIVSTLPALRYAADGSLVTTTGVSVNSNIEVRFNNLIQFGNDHECVGSPLDDSINCDFPSVQESAKPNIWINQGLCSGIGTLAGQCNPAARLALADAGAGVDNVAYVFPRAILDPAAALLQDTIYTVTVTRDVLDEAGNRLASNFQFSFATTAATFVLGTLPESKRSTEAGPVPVTAVANNTNGNELTVCFTQAMSAATLTPASLYLTYRDEGGQTRVVPATVTYSNTNTDCVDAFGDGNTFAAVLSFDVEALSSCNGLEPALPYDTEYTINLSSRIATATASHIPEQKYLLRTGADPVITAIEIGNGLSSAWSVLPASVSAVEVPINSWILVTFSGPPLFSSVDASTFAVLDDSLAQVPGSYVAPGALLPNGSRVGANQVAFVPAAASQRDVDGKLQAMTAPNAHCSFSETITTGNTVSYSSPTGLCFNQVHTLRLEGRDAPSDTVTLRLADGNMPLGTVTRTFRTSPATVTRGSPDSFANAMAIMSVIFLEPPLGIEKLRMMDPGSINIDNVYLRHSLTGMPYNSVLGFDRTAGTMTLFAIPNPATTGFELRAYLTTDVRDYLGNPLPLRTAAVSFDGQSVNVGGYHAYPVVGTSACGGGQIAPQPEGLAAASGHGHDPVIVRWAYSVSANAILPASQGPVNVFLAKDGPDADTTVDCANLGTDIKVEALNTPAGLKPPASGNENDVIIRPVESLAAGTYTVCVREYVNSACFYTNTTRSFPYTVEAVAPTVSSIAVTTESGTANVVAGAATEVKPGTAITVTFSERVDDSSVVVGTSLQLVQSPGAAEQVVDGSVSWNAAMDRLVFVPEAPLAAGAVYELRLTSAITDTAGTGIAPTTSGTLTIEAVRPAFVAGSIAPVSGASVGQDASIVIAFNEPIDLASVLAVTGTGTLDTSVIGIQGTRAAATCTPPRTPACVSYESASNTLTLQPAAPEGLAGGLSYAVSASGILDLGGTSILSPTAVTSFSTTTTAGLPSVLCYSVSPNPADASGVVTVTIELSEAVSVASGSLSDYIYIYRQSTGARVTPSSITAADGQVRLMFNAGTLSVATTYGLVIESYDNGSGSVGVVASSDGDLLAQELFTTFTTAP